jgi:hypothetical protein
MFPVYWTKSFITSLKRTRRWTISRHDPFHITVPTSEVYYVCYMWNSDNSVICGISDIFNKAVHIARGCFSSLNDCFNNPGLFLLSKIFGYVLVKDCSIVLTLYSQVITCIFHNFFHLKYLSVIYFVIVVKILNTEWNCSAVLTCVFMFPVLFGAPQAEFI